MTTVAQRWQRLASELADVEEQESRDEQDKKSPDSLSGRPAFVAAPLHREHLGDVSVSLGLAGIDVSESLAVRVDHLEAARYLLDRPWCWEASHCNAKRGANWSAFNRRKMASTVPSLLSTRKRQSSP